MKRSLRALSLLVLVVAPAAYAVPILYTFKGVASGTIGIKPFTNAAFSIFVTSDTLLVHEYVSGVYACPGGSPAKIDIDGVGVADFWSSVEASVFYSQNVQIVGFWSYATKDLLDIQTSLGTYNLKSPVGPVSGGNGSWMDAVPTSLGDLTFNSSTVRSTTFQASVVPEPAAYGVLLAGVMALLRKRR